MTTAEAPAYSVTEVGRVVAAHGLVTAFGHVSRRLSPTSYEITMLGDLATLEPVDVVTVDLRQESLPESAPGESWMHSEVYRARPDVGGIVRAQPQSSFTASSLVAEMRPIHGQGAWLGASVPVFEIPRLVRSAVLGTGVATTLGESHAVLLRANGALAVGPDPTVAAARMFLLEAACDLWVKAHAAGTPQYLSPDDVDAWSAASAPLLVRTWAYMHRRAFA